MKCIWRIIKTIPKWLADDAEQPLSLDDVLLDVHDFLRSFPSLYWKKRENDTPVR
jgi:cytoskeleton-associated protein 5